MCIVLFAKEGENVMGFWAATQEIGPPGEEVGSRIWWAPYMVQRASWTWAEEDQYDFLPD